MSETPGIRKLSLMRCILRTSNLVVSLIVFLFDCSWFHLSRRFRRTLPCRGIVLYYHSVPKKYAERFEEQMQLVLKLAAPLDLRYLKSGSGNRRFVAITFDDSMESFYNNAVPVLLRLNIPATVFAVADALGTRPVWGDQYYLPGERVMSATQLQSLPDVISIGSHTLTHVSLVTLEPEVARVEITESRQRLENILQRSVTLFSFPHGHFNDVLVHQCREAGYERVFTTEPSWASADNFVVGRVSVDPWDWPIEFRLKMIGAYRWRMSVRTVLTRMFRCLSLGAQALGWKSGFRKVGGQPIEKRSVDVHGEVR